MDVYSRIHVRTGVLASQVDFSLRRSVVLIVLAVVAAVVGVVVYSAYDPSTSQLFPKCIFKSLTGDDFTPERVWGWCLDLGATMIQTDRPADCIRYLDACGRHKP